MDDDRTTGPLGPAGTKSAPASSPTMPWDARLARLLIRPLVETPVHPNHVTTVGLAVGLAAAALYASGSWASLGALLFVFSAVLDHADGELARLSGKTSAFGHAYDRIADLVVKLALFTGMGLGLRHSALGRWAAVAGVAAGLALIAIFLMRSEIARWRGLSALDQPSAGGFEIEDILYAIAPLTWAGWLLPFVVAAGIGAPLVALWVSRQYFNLRAAVAATRSTACQS